VARRCRSSHQTRFHRPFSTSDFAHHGRRRFSCPLERPALILGTSSVRADVRRAPHLIILGFAGWMPLGCRQHHDHLRHPRYRPEHRVSTVNSNSLLGILWVFSSQRIAPSSWRRWLGVLGGALVMCVGAALLAIASSAQAPAAHSLRGVWAALGAGVLWGTMYIPYRKATSPA